MIDIDPEKRRRLSVCGELTLDDEGDEVLVGLTVAETHFYLAFEEFPSESHSPGEICLYLSLYRKHWAEVRMLRKA